MFWYIVCDDGCNFEICYYDGFDCNQLCSFEDCEYETLHNDICNEGCNNTQCSWDYGDCEAYFLNDTIIKLQDKRIRTIFKM